VPLDAVLLGAVLPGLLAGTALLAAWWGRNRGAPARPRGPRWVAPLVVAAGVIAAELAIRGGRTEPWPVSAPERFPHVALAALVLALLDGGRRWPAGLRPAVRFVFGAGATWVLLGALPADAAARAALAGWAALAGLASMFLGGALEAGGEIRRGPDAAIVLAIASLATSAVLLAAHVATLAQLAGALAAVVIAAAVAGFLAPALTLSGGAAWMGVMLLTWLLVAGTFFGSGIPPARLALIGASVLVGVGWINIGSVLRLGAPARFGGLIAGAGAPAALAAALAVSDVLESARSGY
jgi:hypothetical protein